MGRTQAKTMTLRAAAHIIGGNNAGGIKGAFGLTSKMPGRSYGLDAQQCLRGSELAKDPRSMCHPDRCYAKRNFYATWGPVIKNRKRHQKAIHDPRWVDAMVLLMTRYLRDEEVFRWHDSGDLQGQWHLEKICRVAERTPWLKHWIPTHEPFIVSGYVRRHGIEAIPPNLTIRISADRIGDWPELPANLKGFPTSTVHYHYGEPLGAPSGDRRHSVECRANERDHKCGPCRACWSRDVRNVSYPLSGPLPAHARRPAQLRILDGQVAA